MYAAGETYPGLPIADGERLAVPARVDGVAVRGQPGFPSALA